MAAAEPDGETATPASRDPEEPATNSKEDSKAPQEVAHTHTHTFQAPFGIFQAPLLLVKEPPEF